MNQRVYEAVRKLYQALGSEGTLADIESFDDYDLVRWIDAASSRVRRLECDSNPEVASRLRRELFDTKTELRRLQEHQAGWSLGG